MDWNSIIPAAVFSITLTACTEQSAEGQHGNTNMAQTRDVELAGQLYQIPRENLGEDDGLLSIFVEALSEPKKDNAVLLYFDANLFAERFDVDFGKSKSFVVRVGYEVSERRSERRKRAKDVLFGSGEFQNRVVEEGPDDGLFRIYRHDESKGSWMLTRGSPDELSPDAVTEHALLGACTTGRRQMCSFVHMSEDFYVSHRMPERYAGKNSEISQYVIDQLKSWRVEGE